MSEGMPPPPVRRASPWAGRAVLGFVLVLLGLGWLLETLDVDVPWDLLLPVALIGIGGVLVVSARSNAAQGGLIAAGVVLTVLLLIGTAIDVPLGGGVGDRTVRPTGTRIESEVERAIGTLTLDLTEVDFDAIEAPLDVRARRAGRTADDRAGSSRRPPAPGPRRERLATRRHRGARALGPCRRPCRCRHRG